MEKKTIDHKEQNNKNNLLSTNTNEQRNIYIYFNVAYEKSKKYKIYLSEEYKGFNTLEKIEEKELEELNASLILQIYRFKIILENENDYKKRPEFIVYVEEENSYKNQYIIKINDLKRDFYEYNFKIEKIDILPLKYQQQFLNYSQLLKNKYKIKQGTKENDDFIFSSQSLLLGNDKKYDFFFYLLIFLDGFKSNNVKRHLLLFEPDKISGLGELSETYIKHFKNILNIIAKDPNKIHVDENSKEKSKEVFYSIYLYFNLNFHKEEVIKMFDDENKCKYLLNSLINFHNFFEDLLLPKKYVIKLMEKAYYNNKIVNLLFYLGNDCAQFLQVIIEKHELISKCFNDNIDSGPKNKHYLIDIEKYVEAKREDDIKLILECFKKIKENNINFIKFSSSMIERYIELYEEVNPINLLLLKNIISIIKEIDKNFDFKLDNITCTIHNTGLKSVKDGKLKNMELLEFIKGDEYYFDKKYNKNNYRELDVLDGIDINLLKKENKMEDFLKQWKEMNFDKIFEFQQEGLINKISSLIKEINDFELLYYFYNIYPVKESKSTCLIKMQEKYNEITSNFNFENNDTFINQTIQLIYFSDKNKANVEKFLTEVIQKKFDIKTVIVIFINLTQKYDLSQQCQNKIIEYFTKNKQNSNNLIYIILNCEKMRDAIFSNIDNYIIKEEDFFKEDETENYKFFKDLVGYGIFIKDEIKGNKDSKYIKETKKIILLLQEKIKNLDISYNSLKPFFKEKKDFTDKNNKFKERLIYIFPLSQDEAEKCFDNLNAKMKEAKVNIKKLEILLSYFSHFLSNHYSKEIEKLKEIISDMKKQPLKIEHTKEINDFSKYFPNISEYKLRQKSIFFNIVYNEEIKKNNNEQKAMKKVTSEIKNLKSLFETKKENKILALCLKAFKKQDENEIKKELDLLSKLLKIDEKKYNEKKNDLVNDLLLLLKKENLINTSRAINNFLAKLNVKDNEFFKEISNIIKELREKKGIEIIKSCKQRLKN